MVIGQVLKFIAAHLPGHSRGWAHHL